MSKKYPCVNYDNGKCKKFSTNGVTSYCVQGPCEDETPSNADRIRAMTDEELARFMNCDGCPPKNEGCNEGQKCSLCWFDWLQQPAGGADHE